MIKKRFKKFYHFDNKHFFVHIAVDAILLVAVISVAAYTLQLISHPAKSTLKTEIISMPKKTEQSIISADPDSETAARKKIMNELELSAMARYSLPEGDQLGVGPLPPKAGETTRYWIFLSPATNHYDVDDAVVTADLGENIILTGKQSVLTESGVTINDAGTQISWHAGRLTKQYSGMATPGAAFEIAFTPSTSQIGGSAILIKNITITGNDSITGFKLRKTVRSISTAIPDDTTGGIISSN